MGHGRGSPAHRDRPSGQQVRGRRGDRGHAHRLSGNHPGQRGRRGSPQETVRRPGPVRGVLPTGGAQRPGRGLRVRGRHRRRRHPPSVHPGGRKRRDGDHERRWGAGLPGGRHRGHLL